MTKTRAWYTNRSTATVFADVVNCWSRAIGRDRCRVAVVNTLLCDDRLARVGCECQPIAVTSSSLVANAAPHGQPIGSVTRQVSVYEWSARHGAAGSTRRHPCLSLRTTGRLSAWPASFNGHLARRADAVVAAVAEEATDLPDADALFWKGDVEGHAGTWLHAERDRVEGGCRSDPG